MKQMTISIGLLMLILMGSLLYAQPWGAPNAISYSGQLTTLTGEPRSGNFRMTFSIWDAPAGGHWVAEPRPNIINPVAVRNGQFSVLLSNFPPRAFLEIPYGESRYIQVQVDDEPPVVPRQRFVSVPFALRTATINRATGGIIHGNTWISGNLTAHDIFNPGPALTVRKETADGPLLYGAGLRGTPPQIMEVFRVDIAGAVFAYDFIRFSDIRFKKNITPMTGVLERLEMIRGVSFEWGNGRESHVADRKDIGVIAQEVENAFPEVVVTVDKEGHKGVAYDKLTVVLIEALKELKAEVRKLKVENEELKHKVDTWPGPESARR